MTNKLSICVSLWWLSNVGENSLSVSVYVLLMLLWVNTQRQWHQQLVLYYNFTLHGTGGAYLQLQKHTTTLKNKYNNNDCDFWVLTLYSVQRAYTCKRINVRKEIHLTIHHSPGLIIEYLFVNHVLRRMKKMHPFLKSKNGIQITCKTTYWINWPIKSRCMYVRKTYYPLYSLWLTHIHKRDIWKIHA